MDVRNITLTVIAALAAVPVFAARPKPPPLISKLVPLAQWPKLESRAVGLLVQEEMGEKDRTVCQIDHMQSVQRIGPGRPSECTIAEPDSNTYTFAADGKSPVAVYFKSEGQGHN